MPESPHQCPLCRTPKAAGRFCEECGFNFETGLASSTPTLAPPPQEPAPAMLQAAPLMPTRVEPVPIKPRWAVVVAVNSRLRGSAPDPEAPADVPERTLVVDRDLTVGRPSAKRHFIPDLNMSPDTGTSHLQCRLTLDAQGNLFVEDARSANGTLVNGTVITHATQVQDGDVVGVGAWTQLVIKAAT